PVMTFVEAKKNDKNGLVRPLDPAVKLVEHAPIVENDGALPAAFLIVIELAQMRDDALAWPGIGAHALDERVVRVKLAVLGAAIASEKHGDLLDYSMVKEARENQWGRFPLQRQKRVSTTENPRDLQEKASKIACFSYQVRNIG